MKSLRFVLLLVGSFFGQNALAGFCDNLNGPQTIDSIHIFGGRAYVSISPGFAAGGDAQSCERNEFAMDMTAENQKNYYPLLMMALAANKPVQITYCGGCVAHGFKGPSVTVPVLQGLAISK